VSDLRPVLEPARRVFHPRAARADETSAGRLKRSRREPGIISEAGPRDCLKALNDRDWGNEIESVIMGPDASLLVYMEANCKGRRMAFVSNQRVLDLEKFQMANDIESLRVECK
jgi:hypothetical protein